MALHELGVGCDVGRVRPTSWGWLFWLVQLRSGGWVDLRAGIERQCAGVLVLVVACSGADGNGCSAVGAATVEGVGVLAVAAAAVSAGVQRAGSVNDVVAVPESCYDVLSSLSLSKCGVSRVP